MSKTPFRISLGGGGTDLPFYYKKEEGFVISAAVQKYMYILVARRVHPSILLSYSKSENVNNVNNINHEIIRECLKITNLKDHIVVLSHAELGSEYGLGSSGVFTVGLLNSLFKYNQKKISVKELAKLGCHINMDILKQPSGKQDEFIASYGNLTCFTIKKNGNVIAKPLKISSYSHNKLQNNLLFFHTNIRRSASIVLNDQKEKSNNTKGFEYFNAIKKIGLETKHCLEKGKIDDYGLLMDQHWEVKKKTSQKITKPHIEKLYKEVKKLGVLGGKIIGAGGGGIFMCYVNNEKSKKDVRKKFNSLGMNQINLPFEKRGSEIVLNLLGGSQ